MSPTMNIRKGIIKGREMKQTVYEQFGGTYREDNGYLIPGVELPEQKPIGKYGPMQLAPSKSTGMVGSPHCSVKDGSTAEFAKAQGIDEHLKATDQMRWVQMINNIHTSAEETVMRELILA